jgi:prepilin-type N-terminal cleavage/methylation domain-containing protein
MKRSQDMKGPLKSERGFTLVEVLMAAIILLVAILAIATMFPTGRGNVDDAGKRSRAVALAQENLEIVKNSAFPPVTGGCPAPTPSGHTCSMNVSLSGTSPNRLATVTVTVDWKGAPRSGNVSLVTRMAE